MSEIFKLNKNAIAVVRKRSLFNKNILASLTLLLYFYRSILGSVTFVYIHARGGTS